MKKAERLVALTAILQSRPNELLPLGFFAELFATAKSTISEDLVSVKEALRHSGRGTLETVPGAAGGVRFIPLIEKKEAEQLLEKHAEELSSPDRILPGGFLYMADILYDPAVVRPLGLIFAGIFREKEPEVVVTMETKGIPLALMTADALGIPAVVVRHGNKVTEGSSVSINYVSGSSRRIQTMSLTRKALETGKRVLIIDDFIKAGGTAKGIMSLMEEFDAEVVGLGVLMEGAVDDTPRLIDKYHALLQLAEVDPLTEKSVVKANKL